MRIIRGWTMLLATGAVLACGTRAFAQEVELGTQAGLTILHASGATSTQFQVPGAGILSAPTVYLSVFGTSRRFSIDPELTYAHVSSDFGSHYVFAGALRFAGYLKDPRSSPYLYGDIAMRAADHVDSEFAPGLGIGYRGVLGQTFVLRPEFGFRKWSDHGPSEYAFRLAFGVILPHGR